MEFVAVSGVCSRFNPLELICISKWIRYVWLLHRFDATYMFCVSMFIDQGIALLNVT